MLKTMKTMLLLTMLLMIGLGLGSTASFAQDDTKDIEAGQMAPVADVVDVSHTSIIEQSLNSGLVVFTVLLILILFSILSWAIFLAKFIGLSKLSETNDAFIRSFWDSRSLNDLNSRLAEYPNSPAKEVFKSGYAELVRGSQLREHASSLQLAVQVAVENMGRSLTKAKRMERKKMEKMLPLLAIIASASPFIGLFGTVWGIMGAFEAIAKSGNASLAAVAPGISEALIATAFGLAAAIPAVIGYNTANAKIRSMNTNIDGFSMDFLNIVERYLITEKKPNPSVNSPL